MESNLSNAATTFDVINPITGENITSEAKMNIGMDVGMGKDDWSLTFRIGETFGR